MKTLQIGKAFRYAAGLTCDLAKAVWSNKYEALATAAAAAAAGLALPAAPVALFCGGGEIVIHMLSLPLAVGGISALWALPITSENLRADFKRLRIKRPARERELKKVRTLMATHYVPA